jgi:hypothetical protein
MKRTSRLGLIVIAMLFLALVNAIGLAIFGIEPMSKTEFLVTAFVGAWCGAEPNQQTGKEQGNG